MRRPMIGLAIQSEVALALAATSASWAATVARPESGNRAFTRRRRRSTVSEMSRGSSLASAIGRGYTGSAPELGHRPVRESRDPLQVLLPARASGEREG